MILLLAAVLHLAVEQAIAQPPAVRSAPVPPPIATNTSQRPLPAPVSGKTVVLRFEKIIRLEDDPTTFYEVEFKDQVATVQKGTTDQKLYVQIQGNYKKRDWTLFCHSEDLCPGQPRIPTRPNGTFSLNVQVLKKESIIHLVVVPPTGMTHRHHFKLKIDGWPSQRSGPYSSDGALSLGLSVTQVQYTETNVESQDQTALTMKFGYAMRLGTGDVTRWSLQFMNFVTLAALKTSRDPPIRFLGINIRIGYDLPQISRPWGVGIYGGIYYQTTFVAENAYGFANLIGPQLYPTLTYEIGRNRAFHLYAKYSPILSGAAVLPLNNREIAAGLGYRWMTSDMQPVVLGLDLSQLRFITDAPQLNETNLESETLSASFGISTTIDAIIGIFSSK